MPTLCDPSTPHDKATCPGYVEGGGGHYEGTIDITPSPAFVRAVRALSPWRCPDCHTPLRDNASCPRCDG